MKLKLAVGAALAAAVALCVVGFAVAGGSKQASGITFHLVEKEAGGNFVDNKPYSTKGANGSASIGDMFIFSSTLLTRGNKRAGMLYGSCIAATAGKSPTFECTGTFSLAGGQLELQTITRETDKTTQIGIVGGTGAYEGARGSITSVSRGQNSPYSDDTVHLLPKSA